MSQGAESLNTNTAPGAGMPPLFVDLDGSLISTDLLWESLFTLLKTRPWMILAVVGWALQGKSTLKDRVSRAVSLPSEALPYDPAVLELIDARRKAGSAVILATASPASWARSVATHLGLFDAVLATEPGQNLKGKRKLEAIAELCRERGWPRFDYVGDAHADLPIWKASAGAYVVGGGAGSRLGKRVHGLGSGVTVYHIGPPRKTAKAALKALRPRQWAKNILIFVPVVTGHKIFQVREVTAAAIAFVAFSLCASAIYLVNDLTDLAADRDHSEKRRRPFASGRLPLSWGPPLVAALLLMAFGLAAAFLPLGFVGVLGLYLAVTTAYSLVLKSRLMVDVLTLAILYTVRIFAGGLATNIEISEWLIGFSMFFFLSLAFAKRFIELDRSIRAGKLERIKGRGYVPGDIGLVESMGATSGYLSALVLAMYIHSDQVRSLYSRPNLLWGVVLVLIYWISRVWFLARRHEMPGDPVEFALRDVHSLALGVISVIVLASAALLP